MSVLALRDVVKRYATGTEIIRAVDGVSLSVSSAELAALYGPSGSGKTTLLQMAGGLLAPDAGSVYFDEQDIASLSAEARTIYRRRVVGTVLQSFHLVAGATALENAAIKLLADGYSMREAKRRAQPWLARVGLAARQEHTPAELSMGERQRVAIARALVNEPRLLLADEPTGSLDSARSHEIFQLLSDICRERDIPGLLVTHDPSAAAFASAVHTLHDGELHPGLDVDLARPRA